MQKRTRAAPRNETREREKNGNEMQKKNTRERVSTTHTDRFISEFASARAWFSRIMSITRYLSKTNSSLLRIITSAR